MLNELAQYPGFFVRVVTMEILRIRDGILILCEPHLSTAGRWRVNVVDTNGKPRTRLVHVLIWESVYGPVPKGYVIHHINFIRTDNRLENLQLMTEKEHLKLHYAEKKAKLEAGRKVSLKCFLQNTYFRDVHGKFCVFHPKLTTNSGAIQHGGMPHSFVLLHDKLGGIIP